ncbi:hypothetical protein ALMP_12320 [Streptomyces sp. A012304]|nr:hypothetical protein ALMP_12320 [Streptomyces sp. A012304]
MYTLVLPLFAAEVWFVFGPDADQRWATVSAALALGVLAIRYALGPQTHAEAACPHNCQKCRESASWGESQ